MKKYIKPLFILGIAFFFILSGVYANKLYIRFEREREYNSILANEYSDFMIRLTSEIQKKINENSGRMLDNDTIKVTLENFPCSRDRKGQLKWFRSAAGMNASNNEKEQIIFWCVTRKLYVPAIILSTNGLLSTRIVSSAEFPSLIGEQILDDK